MLELRIKIVLSMPSWILQGMGRSQSQREKVLKLVLIVLMRATPFCIESINLGKSSCKYSQTFAGFKAVNSWHLNIQQYQIIGNKLN
jgi:hypothetical protein